MANVSLLMALGAGLLSFFSPCVLPVIPSYVSYVTGITFEDLTMQQNNAGIRKTAVLNSLFFIAGFSLIFILLGASSSFLGGMLSEYHDAVRKAGGVLIVVMGLYIAGVLKIRFLSMDRRAHIQNKPAGLAGSFLVGVAFAAGWTPCIGPVLSSILLYASTANSVSVGIELLTAYAVGLGIPFLAASVALGTVLPYFRKINRYMHVVSAVSGLFLVAVGILLFTGSFSILSQYMTALPI
jgi:cytochrome c-type biogenesis protein